MRLTSKSNLREQKAFFSKLTTDQKIQVWNNKFDQVLLEKLSDEQRSLILTIKNELNDIKNNKFDRLLDTSIKFASISNSKDFEAIFTQLEDAHIQNSANKISANSENMYVKDLIAFKKSLENKDMHFKSENVTARALPYCIYRWLPYDTPAQPCQETNAGCGWLLLQPCTH